MSLTNGNISKKRVLSQTSLLFAFQPKSSASSRLSTGDEETNCSSSALKKSKIGSSGHEETRPTGTSRPIVFCDLDGVLVDFDDGVKKLTGKSPDALHPSTMWSAISRSNGFYRDLNWKPDGQELWDSIRHLTPKILTGVPRTIGAAQQKFDWCKRELCVEVRHVNKAGPKQSHHQVSSYSEEISDKKKGNNKVIDVITCWSKNKHFECKPGYILIDDRISLQKEWEAKGGIFVHHVNAKKTIEMLIAKKIIEK